MDAILELPPEARKIAIDLGWNEATIVRALVDCIAWNHGGRGGPEGWREDIAGFFEAFAALAAEGRRVRLDD